MTPPPGLRERKKQQTREAIENAAHELFAERGYQATTLPDIAEAADVSTRTIFAYFPSKEDILFCEFGRMKEDLGRALAERSEGRDALETVREFIISSHEEKGDRGSDELELSVMSDPELRGLLRARIAQLEEVIAPAIAEDLGAPPGDTRAQVVAASLTAAFNLLVELEDPKAKKDHTPEEIAERINPVFEFLRGGLDALK
jgi:AcrR family transcriptional regulator